MPVIGQQNNTTSSIEKIMKATGLAVKLPLIVLAIVTAGMVCWVGFWFVYRACAYAYQTWLSRPW